MESENLHTKSSLLISLVIFPCWAHTHTHTKKNHHTHKTPDCYRTGPNTRVTDSKCHTDHGHFERKADFAGSYIEKINTLSCSVARDYMKLNHRRQTKLILKRLIRRVAGMTRLSGRMSVCVRSHGSLVWDPFRLLTRTR